MGETSVVERKPMGISTYMTKEEVRKNIEGVVGAKNVDKFISSVVSAVSANPELAKCTNASLINAALLGQSLNLAPSPQLGQMYFVPYKDTDKGVTVAQFQLSYKGYNQLAIRSGQYQKIVATDVKEGELVSYNPFTEELVMNPILDYEKRQETPTIGYYAFFRLNNGYEKCLYWSAKEMEDHARKYSASYRNDIKYNSKKSFWSKFYLDMAKKTLLRQLFNKYGILSVDMQTALQADQSEILGEDRYNYVDNVPDREPVRNAFEVEAEAVVVGEEKADET